MRVIGHRGFGQSSRSSIAENTIRSFEAAIAAGVDGIEFDVRTTRDGKQVIHHDPWIKGLRTAISALTLEEIQNHFASSEKPPALEDVLELAGGLDLLLNVEIKDVASAAPAVRLCLGKENILFSSFLPEALMVVAREDRKAEKALLVGGYPRDIVARGDLFFRKTMDQIGTNHLIAEHHLLPLVSRATQKHGIRLWSWNSTGEKQLRRAADIPVEAIITDSVLEAVALRNSSR